MNRQKGQYIENFFSLIADQRGLSSPPRPAAEGATRRQSRRAARRREESVALLGEVPAASGDRRGRAAGPRKRRRERGQSRSVSPDGKRKPKKQKTGRRKKGRSPSSSSDSGSSQDGGSSSSDSSDGSSQTSGSSSGGEKKATRKKGKQGKWGMLNDIWPIEMRPRKLQDREYVEQQSWRTLNALQDRYEKEAERKGVGAAIFGKDRKLKKTTFKKKKDDGFKKLHPARFLRLPLAAPEKYWRRVPKCHDQRFRHIQLTHYGAESQINEKVILAMHDRQVDNLIALILFIYLLV